MKKGIPFHSDVSLKNGTPAEKEAEGYLMVRRGRFGLIGFLVLILAGTTFAQTPQLQFRASGFIDALTILTRNVAPGDPSQPIYGHMTAPNRPDSFPRTNQALGIRKRPGRNPGEGSS